MNVKLIGRTFAWHGGNRLVYVAKQFPYRWTEVDREDATHVIHAWLPTYSGPWEFKIRELGDL